MNAFKRNAIVKNIVNNLVPRTYFHLTAFVEPKPKGVGVNIKVCTAPGNCVKEQAGVILL